MKFARKGASTVLFMFHDYHAVASFIGDKDIKKGQAQKRAAFNWWDTSLIIQYTPLP